MALKLAPQSSKEPVHKTMQACMDTLHTTQRESNLTTIMLQDIPTFDEEDSWSVERLVDGYKDCCWHPDIKPHTPGQGQFMQPQPHTHLQGHPNREVLGWNQRYPEIETLQCEYPHLYLKIYGDTTTWQWNSGCLHPSLQNSSKAMCF